MNNAEIIDLMLEGAAATKPGKRQIFNYQDNLPNFRTLPVDKVHTACAVGAIRYALSVRQNSTFVDLTIYPSLQRFISDYKKRFGNYLTVDNDMYGRDFVIARVKEMVNEESSS
jgi:hypothetical protein